MSKYTAAFDRYWSRIEARGFCFLEADDVKEIAFHSWLAARRSRVPIRKQRTKGVPF